MTSGSSAHAWRWVAGLTAYVVLTGLAVVALLATGTDRFAVGVLALVAAAGLTGSLARLLGRRSAEVRRLATDTDVIVDANPAHRLDASASTELEPLVVAVNRLAARHESALRGVAEAAEETRREVEHERNRLAALMAQLTVAVVVCNSEGRILLYNEAARSLLGKRTPVGLGRSVFAFVDRGLVSHAHDRLAAGTAVCTATTLHDDRLLRVHVTLVRETETRAPGAPDRTSETGTGFVLVLEDTTEQVRTGDHRERLLRQLTEETRASLGSIRAAAESVLDFPDLTVEERDRFLGVVRDEADRLGRRLESVAGDTARPGDDGTLTDIAADDLLSVLRSELARAEVACTVTPLAHPLWVRTDGYALGRVVAHLATRLTQQAGAERLALTVERTAQHAQVDARWPGRPPAASTVAAWLGEPLAGGSTTAQGLAERLSLEVWCGDLDPRTAYLRLLLPLAPAGTPDEAVARRGAADSRPEFYDFDLFTTRPRASHLLERRLDDLAFTVFDTETTGLDPAGGDRIVSLGAVRVVNGRVLRHETFERLVQPGRPVPAASTAIHGITADMLEGQPTVTEVLPDFARFAEDTILVGHNVSFDLQFVRMAAPSAGVPLEQPALDTLLLHAALHPDHDNHTLEAIAEELGVSVVGRHTALGDALVTAEVFVALVAILRRQGVDTLGAALTAARDTYEARVDQRLHRT